MYVQLLRGHHFFSFHVFLVLSTFFLVGRVRIVLTAHCGEGNRAKATRKVSLMKCYYIRAKESYYTYDHCSEGTLRIPSFTVKRYSCGLLCRQVAIS